MSGGWIDITVGALAVCGFVALQLLLIRRRKVVVPRPDYSHLPAFLMGEDAVLGQAVKFRADGKLYLAPPTFAFVSPEDEEAIRAGD